MRRGGTDFIDELRADSLVAMGFELDHVFVFTARGAPAAERLIANGLREGSRNVHVGQGTANRRFFFEKGMLELLWVEDEGAVRSAVVAPTALAERSELRRTGASPFGICIRPVVAGSGAVSPPFETWSYRPPYLPDGMEIPVAKAKPSEPMLFTTPVGGTGGLTVPPLQPTEHAIGVRAITGVRVTVASRRPLSAAMMALEQLGLATFVDGVEPLMELFFDGATKGEELDLRPDLPLMLRW